MYTTESLAIQQKLAQHSKSFLFFNKKGKITGEFPFPENKIPNFISKPLKIIPRFYKTF